MALAPAQTTHMGVLPSSSRSALTSMVSWPLRWTPPMPPVAKTLIPAMWATIMVAATVVAPSMPLATSSGRSRRLALVTFVPSRPR